MSVKRVINTYIVSGSSVKRHAVRQVLVDVLGYVNVDEQELEESLYADGLIFHPASGITFRATELDTDAWAYEVLQLA